MAMRYIAIDLKSFYASVECVERGLDPLTTNLVVADESRTEKTICLAVTPALKRFSVPGRARLFEVVQAVRRINAVRREKIGGAPFQGSSCDLKELEENPYLEFDYVVARPRMALYMEYSTRIYQIYLKYVAPEDIHVYSCDEVFMDISGYQEIYDMPAEKLAATIVQDVLIQTGITATAGIGSNLYLCKVAMDITAKHIPADENGVRIAVLDEETYRRTLWDHTPLTDFWRVGAGTVRRLEKIGIKTMGDIARYSEEGEDHLYRLFGVNAELLIDHAWGWEPCTISEIKRYRPQSNSISSGQVLQYPYPYEEAKIVVQEMAQMLSLDLVEKNLVTDQMVLTIGYDGESLKNPEIRKHYKGEIVADHYGRAIPRHAHGTANLDRRTSSTHLILEAVSELYSRIVNPRLLIRRINLTACHVVTDSGCGEEVYEQMNLFTDYAALEEKKQEEEEFLRKEKALQLAEISIKKRFGKNAILKGTNFQKGATARERNEQIGGHRA